jgi:hypothetical protein
MTDRSPEIGAPVAGFVTWIGSGEDQQQTPVAAEKQRRVMRLRISPVIWPSFDLMRAAFVTRHFLPANIRRSRGLVNEMAIHIWRGGAPAVPLMRSQANEIIS